MGDLSENVKIKNIDYSKLLCEGFWKYFKSREYADMMIEGNGFNVFVHKMIWAMFSSTFSTVNGTEEACNLIHTNIEQEDLMLILEFMYKGEINVIKSRLDKVREGAELLGFTILVDAINNYNEIKEDDKTVMDYKDESSDVEPSTSRISPRKKKKAFDNSSEFLNDEEVLAYNGNYTEPDVSILDEAILIEFEDEDDEEMEDAYENINSNTYQNVNTMFISKPTSSNEEVSRDENGSPSASLDCKNCRFSAGTIGELRKHYQSTHSKRSTFTYTCPECNFVCNKKLTLDRHFQNKHSNDRPFKCDKCDYRGKTASSLRSHSEMHNDEKFACKVCDQKFTLSCSLHRHMKLHYSGEKKQACHLCTATYRRLWDLKIHLRQIHNVEQNSETQFPSFAIRPSLVQNLKCPHCDYTTYEQRRYANHLAVRHHLDVEGNEMKPKYNCESCDFQCFAKKQLMSHIDRAHTNQTFNCKECDYTAARRSELNQHFLRKHATQKHYMCETCGFLCATQRYLRRHQETHRGSKLVCGVCNMHFTLRSSLLRHGKLHISDEKPHSCHLCSYSARKRYNLKCHLQRIHKVDLYAKEPGEQLVYQEL